MGIKKLTEDELAELYNLAKNYAVHNRDVESLRPPPTPGYSLGRHWSQLTLGEFVVQFSQGSLETTVVIESLRHQPKHHYGWTIKVGPKVPRVKVPRRRKFMGIERDGSIAKLNCYSNAACRKALQQLREYFILDTLAGVRTDDLHST